MKNALVPALFALSLSVLGVLATHQAAYAAACANGVYRAGCAGPDGAAVIEK